MKAKLFARKCSITGKGMNDGWVMPEEGVYIARMKDCTQWLKENWKMTINEAYEYSEKCGGDLFYYTEWEDPSDYDYIEIEGELHEITKYFNP